MGQSSSERGSREKGNRSSRSEARNRDKNRKEAIKSLGKTLMTKEAASRIQSHADRTGRNQEFKARAQSTAEKNEE